MAETEDAEDAPEKKRSKLPLLLGLLVALLGGGGAFFFMYTGGLQPEEKVVEDLTPGPVSEAHFVALDPIVIPLGDGLTNRSLKFTAHLEVQQAAAAQVEALKARIIDVLNTYLRALEIEALHDRRALLLLRSQMLRRIQVVVDSTAVQDLLITEFYIN